MLSCGKTKIQEWDGCLGLCSRQKRKCKPDPRPIANHFSVHPTDKKAPFVAHCISTRKAADDADPTVEMPWDSKNGSGVGLYAGVLWFFAGL